MTFQENESSFSRKRMRPGIMGGSRDPGAGAARRRARSRTSRSARRLNPRAPTQAEEGMPEPAVSVEPDHEFALRRPPFARTTSTRDRFSAGTAADPGEDPDEGGPAVPGEAFSRGEPAGRSRSQQRGRFPGADPAASSRSEPNRRAR